MRTYLGTEARLEVRLPADAKARIEQAAALNHQTVRDFILSVVLKAAEEIVEKERTTRLADDARDQFLALLTDDAPHTKLVNALKSGAAPRQGEP